MTSIRETRESLASLLQTGCDDIAGAAKKVGISESRAKAIWKKNCEIETARRFLTERGILVSDVLSLEEFAGADGCPDVVASMASGPVGIELTACTCNESLNRLSSLMLRVSEFGIAELGKKYKDLGGFCIRYSPNKENVISERDRRSFATELLDFATAALADHQFDDGVSRRFPEFGSRSAASAFENYKLLQDHVDAIFMEFQLRNTEVPVFISPDGIATHFGTSVEVLCDIIRRKKGRREKAYAVGLSEMWLLIHATGDPRSSRIAPISQSEIQKLLAESVKDSARDSGFDHVYIWDGVRGGSVELISGEIYGSAAQ